MMGFSQHVMVRSLEYQQLKMGSKRFIDGHGNATPKIIIYD